MKKRLFILLVSAAFISSARSADPVVVVTSATSVTIDGRAVGTVVDALANNPNVVNLRARLLDAWLAREDAVSAAEKARADAAIAAAAALKDSQLATAAAYIDKLTAALRAANVPVPTAN